MFCYSVSYSDYSDSDSCNEKSVFAFVCNIWILTNVNDADEKQSMKESIG